jgi:riboflavin kinase/FMN adenylyltransferase
MFFNAKIKSHRINSLNQKINQLQKLNLDFLIIIKFNKSFSNLSAEQFIKEIIYKKAKCKYLYVSRNFRFGFKRQGDIKTLKKFEHMYKYRSVVTKPFKINNKIISSSFIRNKISLGKIRETKKLLNREWTVEGQVIRGEKRGRQIGFPTCNIKLGDYIIPRLGVYAVKVRGVKFNKKGIANVGYRPTFNGQSLLLEVNIFGINKNLYNKDINL